jgi:hypothetical protein
MIASFGVRQPSSTINVMGNPSPSVFGAIDLAAHGSSSVWSLLGFGVYPIKMIGTENGDSGVASGCDITISITEGQPIDTKISGNVNKKGRDRDAISFDVDEHLFLLCALSGIPSALNKSESFPEWREVYQEVCKSYYLH